jgi:hypothetical protein
VHKFLFLFSIFVLVACQPVTVQRHEEGPVPVTLRVDDAAYWLEEWHRVIELPADQLQQILQTREQEFARHQDARSRLRLALLLAVGPAAARDQARALTLLEGLDATRSTDSAQALAALLIQILREQAAVSGKMSKLQREVVQADERVKELERQLQALTDIEQSIQQRETPVERKEKQ